MSPPTQLPLGPGVVLLAEHHGLVALQKPPGIRSHPNASAPDPRALLTAPFDHDTEAYQLACGTAVHLLHRLDGPTSGVILVTAEAKLAAAVREQFRQHKVEKTYLALLKASAPLRPGLWRDRLDIAPSKGQVRAQVGTALLAETHVKPLASGRLGPFPLALVQLSPHTGRTHQLRVQCARRNLPIAGDATYGDFPFNRAFAKETGHKRLFLHAATVKLTAAGKSFRFEAPVPEAFALLQSSR